FGLDALYVVTDAITPAPRPRLDMVAKPGTRSAGLAWPTAEGRVFQVERAAAITDLLQPLSPIIPDLSFDDLGALTNRAQSDYRLRQRSEEHTSELQSRGHLVCRLL